MAALAWALSRDAGAVVAPATPGDLRDAAQALLEGVASLLGAKREGSKTDAAADAYLFGGG